MAQAHEGHQSHEGYRLGPDDWSALAAEPPPDAHVLLASSGGRDSLAALAALTQWRDEGRFAALSVTHVDHGLHTESAQWQQTARRQAAAFDVPFFATRVEVVRSQRGKGRGSLEAAARQARYAALDHSLHAARRDDPTHPPVLVTAHHANDQAETVLLALLRGSGSRGLSGMAVWRECGDFPHWRPFLDWSRERLTSLAVGSGCGWVDDPSNDDPGFARNALRHRVLPALERFWPDAISRINRSAARLAEEQALLAELAASDAGQSLRRNALDWTPLAGLSASRQLNVLRQWLFALGCLPPPPQRLADWLGQVAEAPSDRAPRLEWPGGELRRYGGRIYWLKQASQVITPKRWPAGRDCIDVDESRVCRRRVPSSEAVEGGGTCRLAAGEGDWKLRPVQASERLRPRLGAPSRTLKNRFQEAGIPPWEREAAIGLEIDGRLAAVAVAGTWWVDADFQPGDQWGDQSGDDRGPDWWLILASPAGFTDPR